MLPRIESPGVIVETMPGVECSELQLICGALKECGAEIAVEPDGLLVLDVRAIDVLEGSLEWLIGMRQQAIRKYADDIDVSFLVQGLEESVDIDEAIAMAIERYSLKTSYYRASDEREQFLGLLKELRNCYIDSLLVCDDDKLLYEALTTEEHQEEKTHLLTDDE